MKLNWNWGTKLLIAMILFMVLLLTFVFLSARQTFHLVEKDYYPQALEYQGKIGKTNNAKALDDQVKIDNRDKFILLTFQSFFEPSEITGEVVFYRPSDKGSDIVYQIKPDITGRQFFDVSKMLKGKYVIKVDYKVNGIEYFQEETVFVKM